MEPSIVIVALAGLLAGLCAGYLLLYKRHINKVLHEPSRRHRKLPPPWGVLLAVVLVAGVAAVILPGPTVTARQIEADIRQSRQIDEGWEVEVSMDDSIAAAIAWDREGEDYKFAIYRNDSRWTDYVFRHGGKSVSVELGLRVFRYGDSMALISMNVPGIRAVETDGGVRYELDHRTPFALVIPQGDFRVYDHNGVLIDLQQLPWYEETGG